MRKSHSGRQLDTVAALAMGDRIKRRRMALELYQTELSRLSGCSNQTISAIEAGHRSPLASRGPSLCRALKITPNDLFGWDESEVAHG